jgi:hypothetical protein
MVLGKVFGQNRNERWFNTFNSTSDLLRTISLLNCNRAVPVVTTDLSDKLLHLAFGYHNATPAIRGGRDRMGVVGYR